MRRSEPLLLVSVYMPCRGLQGCVEEYEDTLIQLNEVLSKYSNSHRIIIGGDFNEDITVPNNSNRCQLLKQFLSDGNLNFHSDGKTYVGPNGAETSTIDYIFHDKRMKARLLSTTRLESLHENVSDHIPVACTFRHSVQQFCHTSEKSDMPSRVKWDKIDKELYQSTVTTKLLEMCCDDSFTLDTQERKINDVLVEAVNEVKPKAVKRHRKARLKVWTPEIKSAINAKKKAFWEWKQHSRPNQEGNIYMLNKKLATRHLRRLCRVESASVRGAARQQILDARASDTKTFHKLIDKQRGRLSLCVNELHVGDATYSTASGVLQGWREHFSNLATPDPTTKCDHVYQELVRTEVPEIADICTHISKSAPTTDSVTAEEVEMAISSLNKGKAADAYGVVAEHILYGGDQLLHMLTRVVNRLFTAGMIPDSLKLGILTPVYKRKGLNTEAKNYRGITILPVITKILEAVLRSKIQPIIDKHQNALQRGFTKNSSPMNCSLIIEESLREQRDRHQPLYITFLDAKAAFDVVCHDSLLRKLYHMGVEGAPWLLIRSLHEGSTTAIKWEGSISEPFQVHQGVKQGGVLSTDLYKVYNNRSLDRLAITRGGFRIGEICCAAPTCADDTAPMSEELSPLQSLVSEAEDFSIMEHFVIQPVKSVVLPVPYHTRKHQDSSIRIKVDGKDLPVVTETMHMGIMRSANTQESAVQENIKKARRTIYSLMGAGLHGENGLDPDTSIHLLQTYVIPILVYGMEVVLPTGSYLEKLDKVHKKFMKQIMSLPQNVADPAIYIISGSLPVEAIIHTRALSLYGSVARLAEESVEKQLARRQLSVKVYRGESWFVEIRRLCVRYSLPDPYTLLDIPPTKYQWKKAVQKAVFTYWVNTLKQRASLFTSLEFLCVDSFWPGKKHPLIQNVGCVSDVPRIHTKLKLVTGVYVLQVNRARFNQNLIDTRCQLCFHADETVAHFLLDCPVLDPVRRPALEAITRIGRELHCPTDSDNLLQLILDSSCFTNIARDMVSHGSYRDLDMQTRRLCHTLHIERYKRLALIPKRTRK